MNNVTRAANSTGVKSSFETDDVINVYASYKGSKYFQDDFTKQDGSTFQSSPSKYYWPADISSSNKLTFTAIWGATQVAGSAGQIASMEIPGNKDILVARHISEAYEAAPTLNFRHALSQVLVKVKNTNPSLKITITDFQIGYVDKTGAFNLDESSASDATDTRETGSQNASLIPATKWTNTAATAPSSNYSQTLASSVVFTATNGGTSDNEVVTLGDPWILLPQTRDASSAAYVTTGSGEVSGSTAPGIDKPYIAIKMTIEGYNGTSSTGTLVTGRWCCWPVSIAWNPGFKYTYTINVGDGGYEPIDTDNNGTLNPVLGNVIVFNASCTVDAWVDSNTDVSM